ncbi:trimeric intracellular cation channel family protein [Actinomadura darangshiensis]|uniref:Trimeric intracellular cation channel family protein n=1 Tax=Actinomadura darangshiensis TaxID=705336 RepID=A0A4R5BPV2_9ACTN|nr:TRIC cation channel family protein [Actinomadura darangshiensis]TDD87496.1 trimeric intracellular cation channel family protein [Actinomadura darangshiensis]
MSGWLSPDTINTITRYLDLAGVFTCGLLGGVVARAEGLDLFGYLVVGTISGLGGGIIRDTLLQHGTPVALTDAAYLPTAFAGALIAFLIKFSEEQWDRLFTPLDAAVISFWAVVGAQKTLAAGLGWLPALLLGTITAVGGSAVRDLLRGRVPAVLGGNALYATVAVAVAGVFVLCSYLEAPTVGIVAGILLGFVLRTIAHRRGWRLPEGLPLEPSTALRGVRARTRRGSRGEREP